ncbi:MAG TPA: VWA domain-containing protein [Lutibacter sp.]|nr:VWA domain-containing protein [Lutibacter sp.]
MKTTFKTLAIISIVALFAFTTIPETTTRKTLSIKTEKQTPLHIEDEKDNSNIKVALLLDTSNSMDGLIDQAKAQLWDIINELSYAKYGGKNPNLSIALYEYGNDDLESSDGYIRKVLNFSDDLDLISKKLFSLSTNGGSEYCGQVIKTSLDDLKWGKNKQDLNLIFIAGNEEFTQGSISYKSATADANEKNVTVNTIFCGDYKNGVSGKWQDAATRTGGEYFAIDQNKEHVYIVTPFDDIIIQLNIDLNKTYIRYGNQGYNKMKVQAMQDSNAAELNEVVVVKRAVSKSSRMYNNASWDLVDAAKDKKFNYNKIERKNLEKHLQGKTTKEIKIYVEKQASKRKEIKNKINEYNTKRKQYIVKKQKGSKEGSLENALIQTIKKQAKKKNYSW